MSLTEAFRRLIRGFKLGTIPQFGANVVLSSLYEPMAMKRAMSGKWFWDNEWQNIVTGTDGLPIPPNSLRMGHAQNDESFLAAGARSAEWIRRVSSREGLDLSSAAVLDWGCATARVLRHFKKEAASGEFWGCDQHGPSVVWCKSFLSPPFRFLTCTEYPHLPFEDRTFDLIYGLSVFTHILHLTDMWLMELRRILKPEGLVLVTIHDEHTRNMLSSSRKIRELWVANGWWVDEDFATGLDHRIEVNRQGESWGRVTTFFRRDWIQEEWGKYFEIRSFEPESESYQTAVVLKKRVLGCTAR